MIHDFAITETDAVFWDLPVVFDLDAAIEMVEDPTGDVFPFSWDPSYGARIGVLPLGADGRRCSGRRSSPATCSTASTRSGRGARSWSTCAGTPRCSRTAVLGSGLALHRWTVDTDTGRATDVEVDERSDMELPVAGPAPHRPEHRYGYFVQNRPAEDTVDLGGVIKHDYRTGEREVWEPGPTEHGGEWLFVGRPRRRRRRRGVAAQLPPRRGDRRSRFVVLDASDVTAGPGGQRRPAPAGALRLPRHLGGGSRLTPGRPPCVRGGGEPPPLSVADLVADRPGCLRFPGGYALILPVLRRCSLGWHRLVGHTRHHGG